MPWTLIRAAMASVADTALHPMQDMLALPTGCRMNLPGQESGWLLFGVSGVRRGFESGLKGPA